MDVNHRIAARLKQLREAAGLSLEGLAGRSGVSRSNISLIERGESSPTATVLDKLSGALGVALASLFEQAPTDALAAPSPLSRAADQAVWADPATRYVRRQLSSAAPSPLQLVEVRFPPGRRVHYDSAGRAAEIHQQVWLIEGTMEISVGEATHRLEAGDCLSMWLDQPTAFRNPTRKPARYLVALAHLTPRKTAR